MAESADALVSNTSGATRAGSTPALGTETEKVFQLSPFFSYHQAMWTKKIRDAEKKNSASLDLFQSYFSFA